MRSKLALALFLSCWASFAFAQQPAFRTIQSSQDPTGPLGLLTNLNSGQEIDLINAPTTASQSFAFYQTISNNVRQLIFSFGPSNFTVPGLGGSGTQCLHTSNTGVITGTGSDCAGAGITQLTGDVTAGPGSGSQVATLATVNANVGSFGSATTCTAFTTNAKGLITVASAVTCTPAIASITGLGTGVATALGVNVGSAGAFVTFNGAGGTPSSITLTSGTGLPISTGVSGLGTGIATALGTNVGSAGAPVVNGGVLGTPSSGTLTNATGYTVANLSDSSWSTYTPSSAFATPGTSVMGAAAGRFKQIGKVMHFTVDCTVTTVGTGTGAWLIGLPSAANASAQAIGATGKEVITTGKLLSVQLFSTTTLSANNFDNTSVATGGNGSRVQIAGFYELP